MLNKIMLAVALTLALASAANALTRHGRWMQSRDQIFTSHATDDVLFERAKGGIAY